MAYTTAPKCAELYKPIYVDWEEQSVARSDNSENLQGRIASSRGVSEPLGSEESSVTGSLKSQPNGRVCDLADRSGPSMVFECPCVISNSTGIVIRYTRTESTTYGPLGKLHVLTLSWEDGETIQKEKLIPYKEATVDTVSSTSSEGSHEPSD